MASKQNSGKNAKGSSAEDIIESLAKEMGVDEEEDSASAEVTGEEADEETAAAEEDALTTEADDVGDAPDPHEEPTPKPAPAPVAAKAKAADKAKPAAKGKTSAKPDASPALSMLDASSENGDAAAAEEISNEESIAQIFSGTGEERTPRPVKIEDEDEPRPKGKGAIWLGVVLVAGVGAAGAAYATLDEDRKTCLRLQIEQRDAEACTSYFRAIEDERIAEERRQRLANAPKFGTLTIITEPKAARVIAEGQEQLIFPGSRTDVVVPARTQLTFQNISVSTPFTFTLQGGGNYEDRTIVVPSYDASDSPWVQNQISGDYAATLTYTTCWPGAPDAGAAHCLTPVAERAAEMRWRASYTPPADAAEGEITRLPGTITITSNPPGAAIAYNNVQLFNEETGEPYFTPHTFNTYNAPRNREDRTPIPVFLTREGLPITVLMEGKVATTDGIYAHQFLCEPVEGAVAPPADAENPDWRGYCNYTYTLHLDLRDPPPPAEGSGAAGEGTGAAGEGTGAAGEGTGAAGEGTGAAGEGTGN